MEFAAIISRKWALRNAIVLLVVTMAQCQFSTKEPEQISGMPEEGLPKRNTFIPMDDIVSLTGSVRIRLEPHGSIRVKMYAKGQEQFEYILDRSKPQDWLTKDIKQAQVSILRLENTCFIVGLALDDLSTGRRYVLDPGQNRCCWARQEASKLAPTAQKPVFINGYGASITQDQLRFEDPL